MFLSKGGAYPSESFIALAPGKASAALLTPKNTPSFLLVQRRLVEQHLIDSHFVDKLFMLRVDKMWVDQMLFDSLNCIKSMMDMQLVVAGNVPRTCLDQIDADCGIMIINSMLESLKLTILILPVVLH